MNILFSDRYLYGFNKDIADIANAQRQIENPHSENAIFDVFVDELVVRIMACAGAILSSAAIICLAPLDFFFINTTLIHERDFDCLVVLKVNFLYLKIIVGSISALVCATVVPRYVYCDLKFHNCIRRDLGKLLAEIPQDLQTLVRKTAIQLPPENGNVVIFQKWREQLAMYLAETLPDKVEVETPAIVDFNFSFYTLSFIKVVNELQAEIQAKEEEMANPEKVNNWKNSKIEEDANYKAIVKIYLAEDKVVPLNNPGAALKQLESEFAVQGKREVRKKMRELYLRLHPDKTKDFTDTKRNELQKLFTFANEYIKFAMG